MNYLNSYTGTNLLDRAMGGPEDARPLVAKPSRSKMKATGAARQPDRTLRFAVEAAAVKAVREQFEAEGWDVESVESERVGWDLEATRHRSVLRLEVKGCSSDFGMVELTPNEYSSTKTHAESYRVCVVANALDPKKRRIRVFRQVRLGTWEDDSGRTLRVQELRAARLTPED